jgi:hypothetical protein
MFGGLAGQFLIDFSTNLLPVRDSPVDRDALLPKQAELLDSAAPEVMMSGAFGCGKTYGLCLKVYDLAQRYPGIRLGLFRETLKSLRPTTLKTLLDGDGSLPPAVPPDFVAVHNKFEHTVYLRNGSEIIYGGLRSSSKSQDWFNSLNLGGVAVDQAEELSQEEWQLLEGRLRQDVDMLEQRQIVGACNPRHPGHWIYQRFFIEKPTGTHLIKTKTLDNPHLPDDYIARLNRFTGRFYERFVLGEWVGMEGLVYPEFDPNANVTTDADYSADGGPILWGCDDGYAEGHERVILIGQRTKLGGVNVFYEYAKCFQSYDETIDELLSLPYPRPTICAVGVDSPHFRGELHKRAIGTSPGNDSKTWNVQNGIRKTRQLIRDGNDMRLLKVHPRCKRLIRGMQSYRLLDNGKPVKEDDNEVDALRYLARYV